MINYFKFDKGNAYANEFWVHWILDGRNFLPTCLLAPTCLLDYGFLSLLHVYSPLHVYQILENVPSCMFISPYTFIRNSRVVHKRSKTDDIISNIVVTPLLELHCDSQEYE